jgi:hypothetical protein
MIGYNVQSWIKQSHVVYQAKLFAFQLPHTIAINIIECRPYASLKMTSTYILKNKT